MTRIVPPRPTAVLLALAASAAALAADSATSDSVVTMEKLTVNDVPAAENILPTARPISSVYGDGMSAVDIPRSVSSVNKAWMDDRQVRNAMDFGQFAPGVYSPAQYGIPATPQIRGDLGQIYIDGQSMLFNRNEIFPSFNGVEAMDIVKGPGSAVYGPQGQGPGGYVNLVTKQPYFDRTRTDISTTLGYWTSGHSYLNPSMTIDQGGPLSPKLAYRLSVLGQTGDNYYLGTKNDTQDIYAALTYLCSPSLKVEWWGQMYSSRFNQVAGVNRVTQNFIWHGDYVGGPAAAGFAGIFATLIPSSAHVAKLPAYVSIEAPFDSNYAKRIESQLTATKTFGEDSFFVDRVYFEDDNARQFEGFGYTEWEPIMQSIQNRAEYHRTVDLGPVSQSLIAGVDLRYTRQITYNDYSLQPFFYFDLTQPLDRILMPGYDSYLHHTVGGYQIPGAFGYSSDPYSNGNQDSRIYDSAVFLQDRVSFTRWFSVLGGMRLDHVKADDKSPAVIDSNTGAYLAKGALFGATDSVNDPSYYVSLIFKASEESSFYVTYDRVDAILGNANFGGIGVALSFNPAQNTPQSFHDSMHQDLKVKGTLYEAGYKRTFLAGKSYVAASVFQQLKAEPQISGPSFLVKDNGIELDAVYQPTRALSVNANFTYQNATAFAPPGGFYQQTGNYLDGYPVGFMVDGKSGTGVGAVNFGATTPSLSRIRAPGVPQVLANAFVEYRFTNGFGIGLGPRFNGTQPANDQNTLHIPGEYELDGYVSYRTKGWDVRINVNNITNKRLLDPIDVTFAGNDLIYVRQPITASLTFRIHL